MATAKMIEKINRTNRQNLIFDCHFRFISLLAFRAPYLGTLGPESWI